MRWMKQLKIFPSSQLSQTGNPFGIQSELPVLEVPRSIQVRLSPVTNETGNLYITQTSIRKTRRPL